MGLEGLWIPLMIGAGVGVGGGMMISNANKPMGSMKAAPMDNPTATAGQAAGTTTTDQSALNKKMAASMLTADWQKSTLGKKSVLGA